MQWWLTVFFLLGSQWVSGDQLDGWGSRPFSSQTECEKRQEFAQWYAARHPLGVPARWVCSRAHPAPTYSAENPANDNATNPSVHWYEPSNPAGLEVFTSEKMPWMAKDAVGLRYTGPVQRPFADELRKLLLSSPQRFSHVVLEIDSDGGEWEYVKEVVRVLKEVRARTELTTRVTEGSLCASGCIPIFMQGEKRKASGSSIWVFHGARSAFMNLPDPAATEEYLDMLSSAGMKPGFRAILEQNGRIYVPGRFIMSGHELFDTLDSGIITELYPAWREEPPTYPSGGIGPH